MKLTELGEFALIDHLTRKFRSYSGSVILGIGDDAAAIRAAGGKYLLFTCDMLVENRHFQCDRITPEQLGHKALAVSLSDIAAMGGFPRYALISAGWPAGTEVDYAEKIYQGIGKLAASHGVYIIGGDTVSAPQLILDVTVIGEMDERPVTRTGAQPGDIIAVTGSLGTSAAGLALLNAGAGGTGNVPPDQSCPRDTNSLQCVLSHGSRQSLIRAHLMPQPRVKEAAALLKAARPTAMIDISDGLAGEIHHICKGSRVGAEIDSKRIPIREDTKVAGYVLGKDYLHWALYGGEDYELLLTLPEKSLPAAQKALGDLEVTLNPIGRIRSPEIGIKLVLDGKRSVDLKNRGYDHFA